MARIQESKNPQCLFLSDFKEEIKIKRVYKNWRREDKQHNIPTQIKSTNLNAKPYPTNILRDAYINMAEHPILADFLLKTNTQIKDKRRRRYRQSQNDSYWANLEGL